MIEAKLWRPKRQRTEKIHEWRPRRDRVGELVQWDTSEHAWLENRGPKLYLISMIDDASSRIHARFARHDSTEENMRLLWSYFGPARSSAQFLHRQGKPVPNGSQGVPGRQTDPPRRARTAAADTDWAGRFRNWALSGSRRIRRKRRDGSERSFDTAQDRLVKGLRVAGANTLEQANAYLETVFIPWWNQTLTVLAAHTDDAHRALAATSLLARFAELCRKPARCQRLHDSVRPQALPDRARRHPGRFAGIRGAGRNASRRVTGGTVSRWLCSGQRMLATTETARCAYTAQTCFAETKKPMDE